MAESGEKLRPENVTQFARHEITRTRAAEAAALRTPAAPSHITVTIDSQAPGSVIEDLSRILKKAPLGSQKVSVRISGQTIATSFSISSTDELLEELRSLSGVSGIAL